LKHYNSLNEIQADLKAHTLTVPQLVSMYLKNIEEKNKELNALIEVYAEESLEKAQLIQEKLEKGTAGILAGMVISIKDNICYKGHQSSASSAILNGFESLFSASAIERILAEDAIIIGRTNCDEFAMGASNETSVYGPVFNAKNQTKVSGGSSGGAAVSVQANMCLAALGSDTGGSVRQPASFCGLVGYKPTYGAISRWGLIAYASSFDIIGPITNTVEDTSLLVEVMSGSDGFDATARQSKIVLEKSPAKKKMKIAYLKEAIESEGIEANVKAKTLAFIEQLKAQGHELSAVSFPYLDVLVPVYYTLTTAEASSNLSRFAGMHYGKRSELAKDLETTVKFSRTEGFGTEVKRRIMTGTFVLSSGYYDAYYSKAQKVRRLIKNYTDSLFTEYDFIVSPTSPTVAFGVGEKASNPLAMYLADIFTVHANIAGNPAISIPFGEDSTGMPIGIQLMAATGNDAQLLSFSQEITN
jgi:aspartyl-tRNA(Asn)/glutamyl-tRNA(Gln) amidotransferase subunit A